MLQLFSMAYELQAESCGVMAAKQVKSKQRVADHGEVFTAEREVNAMLDLVKQETERIDSRFLEPACGDGNFLAEILRRKLVVVERESHQIRLNRKTLARTTLKAIDKPLYEKNAFIAVTSIYGIDIMQDNVDACRERMFSIWNEAYTSICKDEATDLCRAAVRYVLKRNIVCGNALSMMQVDSLGNDIDNPIILPEWSFVMGDMVKRTDNRFSDLMNQEPKAKSLFKEEEKQTPQTLFDMLDTPDDQDSTIIRTYSPCHYLRLPEQG